MSLSSKVRNSRFVQGYDQTASPKSIHSAHKQAQKHQKKIATPKQKKLKEESSALKKQNGKQYIDHNLTLSKERKHSESDQKIQSIELSRDCQGPLALSPRSIKSSVGFDEGDRRDATIRKI